MFKGNIYILWAQRWRLGKYIDKCNMHNATTLVCYRLLVLQQLAFQHQQARFSVNSRNEQGWKNQILEIIWPTFLNSTAHFLQQSRNWNTFIEEQQIPISTPEMTGFLSSALLMVSVSSSMYVLKQYIQKATTAPFRVIAYSQSFRNYLLHKCMTHLKTTFRWKCACTVPDKFSVENVPLPVKCPHWKKVIMPTLKTIWTTRFDTNQGKQSSKVLAVTRCIPCTNVGRFHPFIGHEGP